jgi:hypothetical protein
MYNIKREQVLVEGDVEGREGVVHRTKKMVLTTCESDFNYQIFIGSQDIYCIDAIIHKGTFQDPITGRLSKLRYDHVCSLDGPFEAGVDTMLLMHFLLTYIHKRFPTVQYLTFNDTSTKDCGSGAGAVSLIMMKVLLDGTTWYESRFGAYLPPPHDETYLRAKAFMTSLKERTPFETFVEFSGPPPTGMDAMREAYDGSHTWQEFFTAMKTGMGFPAYCRWLASKNSWFETFVRTYLKFIPEYMDFHLTPKAYPIQYQLEAMRGGRRTRRARRRRTRR